MKFPLFIAHGQDILLTLLAIGAGVTLLGLGSIIAGLMKKKENISGFGLVSGTIAALFGVGFIFIHRFQPPYFDPLMFVLMAPLLFGLVGVALSLKREKEPNQPPPPTLQSF